MKNEFQAKVVEKHKRWG